MAECGKLYTCSRFCEMCKTHVDLLSIKIFVVKDVSRFFPLIVNNIENSAVVISWPAEGYINAGNTLFYRLKSLQRIYLPTLLMPPNSTQPCHPDLLPKSPRPKPAILAACSLGDLAYHDPVGVCVY